MQAFTKKNSTRHRKNNGDITWHLSTHAQLRSKTGCKTVLISINERKTHCMPPFAISQISQGSKCFSPAYTPCNPGQMIHAVIINLSAISRFNTFLLKIHQEHNDKKFQLSHCIVTLFLDKYQTEKQTSFIALVESPLHPRNRSKTNVEKE
jgi:hypothetical protein